MTGYRMDWKEVKADQSDVLNAMKWPIGEKRIEALTAMGRSLDKGALYLLFSRDCDRKWELSQQLIEYWHFEKIDVPKFLPIDGEIRPSPFTLDIRGPFWSDESE